MPSAETGVVGRRCAQWLIDRLIASVPVFALTIVLLLAVLGDQSLWFLPSTVLIAGLLLGNVATDVWIPHRTGGRTPGMRLLGLRIVTEWGGVPKLGAYGLRYLLMVVDGFAFGLVGVTIMIVNRRHQRLGDVVARTLVVRSAPPGRDHPVDALREHADRQHQHDGL